MPQINVYKCNKCSFSMPSGWGGYVYVIDDSGKRIICPHPGEIGMMWQVLGPNANRKIIEERTGYNSDCVCCDCLKQFALDIGDDEQSELLRKNNNNHSSKTYKKLEPWVKFKRYGNLEPGVHLSWRYFWGYTKRKDQRKCPYCNSENVRTLFELIRKTCPKCKQGIIEEIKTGMMS